MADPRKEIYRRQAECVIENMKKRNIEGLYFETKEEAIKKICSMVPKKAVVGLGGSTTIVESGLVEALRGLDIELLDRYKEGVSSGDVMKMRIRGLTADVFIASSNAVTKSGKLVNEDGLGNRVASMIFGPEKVILMVGMNKLVRDVQEGMKRIKEVAAPRNSIRFGVDTPCSRTGFCDEENCFPPKRICSQLTVIEANAVADRLTVVLVGEEMGY
jgi:hypothetical protein